MDFPAWYKSTAGPQISKTIFNVVGSFLPVFDLVLLHFNVSIPGLSDTVQALIASGVFVYFAIQSMVGYVRAKKSLQAHVAKLQSRLRSAGMSE